MAVKKVRVGRDSATGKHVAKKKKTLSKKRKNATYAPTQSAPKIGSVSRAEIRKAIRLITAA